MGLIKNTTSKTKGLFTGYSYYIALFLCAMISASITILLYQYTQKLLVDRLHERLYSIASTAALQFNANEVEHLSLKGIESFNSSEYISNVFKLQRIRAANSDIKYAYIFGKTEDPKVVKYVVDADAASLTPAIDFNHDGKIDEEDVSTPGELYDASEEDVLQKNAFLETSISEISTDEWGQFLSVYSPISQSTTLALDVEVTDYLRIIRATFLPFLLFTILLLGLLTVLTLFIVRIWKSRTKILTELDRQKDELLGIVAHQLAKPITAIRWDLESLLDGDLGTLNPEQHAEAETMRTQAVNLADLVSMILDVSRIQLGRIQFDARPLDLNELFKEMLEVIKPTIVEKKINFVKKMPESLPTVLLDKRYTRMTIENLLTNAVKYTPEGGTVTLDMKIEDGEMCCKISDTGCGIPKQDQAKIFGKMYRASNVVNSVDGNGFGLYVAKGAVEGQGGAIRFESTEGEGTTFFIELPLKIVQK